MCIILPINENQSPEKLLGIMIFAEISATINTNAGNTNTKINKGLISDIFSSKDLCIVMSSTSILDILWYSSQENKKSLLLEPVMGL